MAKADPPDPCELIPRCPVCLSNEMVFAVRTGNVDICVCKRCGTSLSVPHDAWDMREQPNKTKHTPPK
jgi:hypothetical protein